MKIKRIIILFLMYFVLQFANSQNNTDIQYRFSPSIDYKINKKWKVGFDYRYGLEKDISTFQSSVFQLSGTFKISKKLSLEAGYRYKTSFDIDDQRLFTSFNFEHKIKKFVLSSTTKYQIGTAYFNANYWNDYKKPTQYFRQKIDIEYNIPKSKISLSIAPEAFIRIKNRQLEFSRMRYNFGTNYKLKYGNTIGLSCFYEDVINPQKNDRFVIVTKYNLNINDLKAKKSKKKTKKTTD